MKYFVLYTFNSENSIKKYYLKGKSMKHMEDRIKKYSNGMLVTSKWTLFTDNIEFGFLREVNPTLEFPHALLKKARMGEKDGTNHNSRIKNYFNSKQ